MKTPTHIQTEDAVFLSDREDIGGALFSDPGTGKTLTALEAVRKTTAYSNLPVLVAAPPIALRMWAREAEEYLNANVQVIRSGRDRIDESADVVVVSYSMASQRSMSNRLHRFVNGGIAILDESDALKTLGSQRTKAFYGRAANMNDCILENVSHTWPLTGTPIRKYADDLYPQLKALHYDVLKKHNLHTLDKFQHRFCVMVPKKFGRMQRAVYMPVDNRNMEELRRLVYGNKLAVRRRLADVVASLPAFKEREVTIGYEVTEGLLEAMRGKPRGRTIEGMIERDDPYLSTIMRELGKAKAEGIADYIAQVREEEQDGRGTLVLFWHHDTADRIQELLSLHPLVQRIDGNTSSKNKAKIEDAFNRGEVAVLLGQIASMGVSINLQEGGNHVIFAETGWSPAAIKQAYHRVLRWGQEKDVQVDYCVSEHEVDIAVANVRERKQLGINQLHGENR